MIFLLCWILTFSGSLASSGDYLPEFRDCVSNCIEEKPLIGFWQQLLFWGYKDECQYHCMWEATQMNEKIHQFYGKWPFIRYGGIQEPASVVFSLMNLVAQVALRNKLLNLDNHVKYHPAISTYRNLIEFQILAQVNAWIWSSVFHTRDLPWTEKMDYFSAMFVLLVSLLPATYRAFRLDLKPASQRSNIILFISSVSLVFFIFHISYLSFKSFDYGYNMTACLVVAAILNILWMSRFLLHFKVDNNQKALFFTICYVSGMSLELFDFPPIWFVFDAHSLWYCISFIPVAYFSRHLCTAVFGYFLGSVQIEDLVIANGERLDDQPPVKFDKNFCKVDSINSKKSR